MVLTVSGKVMSVKIQEKDGVVKKTISLYQDGNSQLVPVRVPYTFDVTEGQDVTINGRLSVWSKKDGGYGITVFAK